MTPVPAAAVKNTRCAMAVKNYVLRTLFALLVVILFLSCDFLFDDTNDSSVNFWAKDFSTSLQKNYSLKAELVVTGKYCNVWVEKDNNTGKSQAKNIANAYDNKVHQQMINAFGVVNPSYNGRTFSDIMKFADWLGDGDGKLCILLLDIKDNYKKGGNESYVAGYFWAGNFFSMSGSNYRDMIYIDTRPGMEKGIESAVNTLAHEMQHLINFVTTCVKRSVIENNVLIDIDPMDTWIDEGLSSAAEYIVNNEHLADRIRWYNENGNIEKGLNGLIDQGNNFYVWGNRMDETIYAVLDDYATVYLFFQWLRIHKGGLNLYRNIISSSHYDYQAVTTATGENWDNLLKNWMEANYINDSAGIYGYNGQIEITANYAPEETYEINLYPGEGVYSLTEAGDTMPAQGTNIRYAWLDRTGVNDNAVYAERALLTYNRNIELGDDPEIGIITGKVPPSANIMSMARSAVPSNSGPFRVGAGDMLRMNGGKKEFPLLDFLNRLKEDAIVE
jgi:hypothetical protein